MHIFNTLDVCLIIFSYLFKSNVKMYDSHQEIAHMVLRVISASTLFLRATRQPQLFIVYIKQSNSATYDEVVLDVNMPTT
jgi:uncharacterized protein YueI